MNQTASLTLCQYCEHANPADAKFCAGCGAPLHLIPCPQCGAVNDKSSKSCYQCHGELRESTEILLAGAPASASEEAAGNAESPAMPSPYVTQPPPAQRQPIIVVAIILAAFVAAAYFAYQQRSAVFGKGASATAGTDNASVKSTEPSPANLSAGAINKAPPASRPVESGAPAPASAGKGAAVSATEAARAVEAKPGKTDESLDAASLADRQASGAPRAGRRRAQVEPPISPEASAVASSARPSPGTGIEKTAPRITSCTEGLAALGLCTPGPTKGKE